MSLMPLCPEAVRVRRLAKAHAAGELSTDDYRLARREAVERLGGKAAPSTGSTGGAGVLLGDDTETRSVDPLTLAVSGARSATSDAIKPAWSLASWLKWVIAVGVVAAMTYAAAAAEVPPVADRDPNPATSPRYAIDRLVLTGVDDLPGIDAGSVNDVAAAELQAAKLEQAPGPEGFTDNELVEVGRYLASLGVHESDARLSAKEADQLVALVADQKRRRGLSLNRLESIAASVQSYLREQGLPLASVFVPSQRVSDGALRIDVLPGRLAEVDVDGPAAAQQVVERLFADQMGAVVTETVGNRLLQLSDLAGLTVQGAFEAGDGVGESRLRVAVLEDARWQGAVFLDNFGDDRFGDHRLGVVGRWLNPTGVGDRIDGHLLKTFSPSAAWAGGLGYARPFGRLDDVLSGSIDLADAEASGLPGRVDGEVVKVRLGLARTLVRSRSSDRVIAANLHRHELSLTARDDQSVTLLSLDSVANQVFDRSQVAVETTLQLAAGRVSSALPGQDATLWLARGDLFAWTPVTIANQPFKLSGEATVQLADSQLPETLRLPVGGGYGVRGFDFSVPALDRGVALSAAAHRSLGPGELRVFGDAAYGDRLGQVDDGFSFAASIGLGWRMDLGPAFDADLTFSTPVTSKQTGGLSNDGTRVYWTLRYRR